jgi:GT2 family glycosyltransferase
MGKNVELSIVIVNYNVKEFLIQCIQSIYNHLKNIKFEIIVIDNSFADNSQSIIVNNYPEILWIQNIENVGFAKANNQGFYLSKGQYVLLLNPDTIILNSNLIKLIRFMCENQDVGMCACRILNPDKSLQPSIRNFPTIKENIFEAFFINRFFAPQYNKNLHYQEYPFSIDYCTGAFILIRRSAIKENFILNPDYFMYSEEKDLALRLKRKGYKTYYVPYTEIIHYGGLSTNQMPLPMFMELQKSQIKFYKINYQVLHAWLLVLSWGLVLWNNLLFSLPLAMLGKKDRLGLFYHACKNYPGLLKTVLLD